MSEEINAELAINQFQGLCRSAGIELSDLLYVAGRLTKAEDLRNVHPEPLWRPRGLEMHAEYVGPITFWKEEQDQKIADYFQDLRRRTELQFQNVCREGGYIPNPNSIGYKKFSAETITPSGKVMRILVTQHYTYEQDSAHRASRGR